MVKKEDIAEILGKIEPEAMSGNKKYYVEFDGKKYPIKQIVGEITELPRIGFTAMDAYRILTKLGFSVKELK